MKRLLLTTAAMASLACSAHAADKPAEPWTAYLFGKQICQNIGSPPKVMEMIRSEYHADPTADDVLDANGKVIATVVSFWSSEEKDTLAVHMFRGKAACEAYAATRRIDTSQYE
jgi:hypothetical protein